AFDGTVAEPGSSVSIREDGLLRGRVASDAQGAWAQPIAASDGTHTYSVTVDDAAGNTSPPVTITVRVDLNAPDAPASDSPADGSAQRSRTVVLSGRAEPGATVAVSDGGAAAGSAAAGGDGKWTLTLDGVTEGEHAYTATATDEAGRTGPASAARHVR